METFKIEAENFDHINSDFQLETIHGTNDIVLSLVHLRTKNTDPNITAEAVTSFPFEPGLYDVTLGFFDEEDGAGTYEFKVAGSTITEFQTLTAFTTPATSGNVANINNRTEERIATDVNIFQGDDIEIVFTTDQGESRGPNFIAFERVGNALSRSLGAPIPAPERGFGSEQTVVLTKEADIFKGTNKGETVRGKNGNDLLLLGAGDDKAIGGPGKDKIVGGSGRDYLHGGEDKDFLIGGGKGDELVGGEGKDIIRTGAGRDTIAFNGFEDERDTIVDFNINKDLIDLTNLLSEVQYSANSPFEKFNQFVEVRQSGQNSKVMIDSDGVVGDAKFTTVAVLRNVDASTVGPNSFLIE